MDLPGDHAEPGPGVDPAAAFFGFWPRIAERVDAHPATAAPPHRRVIAPERPRLRIA